MTKREQDPALQQMLFTLSSARSLDDLDDETLIAFSERLEAARSRQSSRPASPRAPQRARALDALDILGVPATPKMVASTVEARTGVPFDARALATARRDDRVSWDREVTAGRTPSPKLSPALHHEVLDPVRALVCVSTWDLPRRIVTPHSPGADHAAAVLALLEEAERIDGVDPDAAARVAELAARMSVGIPGGGFGVDRDALRRAATEEHSRFAERASEERAASAQRATMIRPEERVWGRGAVDAARRRNAAANKARG